MANENMIQKHEDNFLAKIAGGATPVDTNVRNSKEFWLNKIADWTGGKSTDDASTEKIYWHTVAFERYLTGYSYLQGWCIILNNSSTPINKTAFINLLKSPGFVAVVINGRYASVSDPAQTNADLCLIANENENNFSITVRKDSDGTVVVSTGLTIDFSTVNDLGVNAIN